MSKNKKIGVSRTPPSSEAKPLGTPAKRSHTAKAKQQLANKPAVPLVVADDPPSVAAVADTSTVATSGVESSAAGVQSAGIETTQTTDSTAENISSSSEKTLDTSTASDVDSNADMAITPSTQSRSTQMNQTLTLKSINKKGTAAIFNGLNSTVRIGLGAFTDKKAPQTVEIVGEFAPASARASKIVETKEERKARLAALPKLTLAQKIEKRELSLQKMRDKAAKQASAGAQTQPELATV